jgi:hypothetical protein
VKGVENKSEEFKAGDCEREIFGERFSIVAKKLTANTTIPKTFQAPKPIKKNFWAIFGDDFWSCFGIDSSLWGILFLCFRLDMKIKHIRLVYKVNPHKFIKLTHYRNISILDLGLFVLVS